MQWGRDYRRAMQEAELLGNFVRLADSVLVAAVAAQASLPLNYQIWLHVLQCIQMRALPELDGCVLAASG